MKCFSNFASIALTTIACVAANTSLATLPYVPTGGPFPVLGPGVAPPTVVGGKEYSHDRDESTVGAGGVPDPEQVIAWDGAGGALDGVDFSGSRGSLYPLEQQVDAIANHGDFLYTELKRDRAHLIFSHDDTIFSFPGGFAPIIPSAGPVLLSNGNTIGGSGEVSVELSGVFSGAPPEVQTLWAADVDVNGMPTPKDVDGVEVWGPEPGTAGDTDKYSLEIDIIAGASLPGAGPPISVFSYDSTSGTSTPYIDHPTIVGAVSSLLGMPFGENQHGQPGIEGINLDALMVQDRVGDINEFEPGDEIIFSISQMVDPTSGSYYATGSELFVLDGSGGVSFLSHGGHVWDPMYAMMSLRVGGPNGQGIIDINAIEAISESSVPEPCTIVLTLLGCSVFAARRWMS